MYDSLLYESESTSLDFKLEQYEFEKATDEKKSELLKDILAFANAWRRSTAYILIGVQDTKTGKAEVVGIDKHIDDAQLQQFVSSKTNIPVDFSYKNITLNEKKIGVMEISHKKRPVYLKKDYGKLKAGVVYYRRGSSTAEASPDEIFNMGKDDSFYIPEEPSLVVEFFKSTINKVCGKSISINATVINLKDHNMIPDYSDEYNYHSLARLHIGQSAFNGYVNNNYYRQAFKYDQFFRKTKAFELCILNNSRVTANHVKIVLKFNKKVEFKILTEKKLPHSPKKHINSLDYTREVLLNANNPFLPAKQRIVLHKQADCWLIELFVDKLHAGDRFIFKEKLYISTESSFTEDIKVNIYGDNISAPIAQSLSIACEVEKIDMSLEEVMLNLKTV